jgi:4,5-DOPA dioxygenase extradiol
MNTSLSSLSNNKSSDRLPVIFIGHGNPMNAILDNAFTRSMAALGKRLPRPQTIVCISAHWMTEGSWVTHMPHPKTIHDFYGFPKELFDVEYPANGNPELAAFISEDIQSPKIVQDDEMWGIDHGTWSVLKHMYPNADIPVVQLSIYMARPPEYHFDLGQQLRKLRNKGVLIIGSGNLVHNLGIMNRTADAKPYDWAIEFDEWVKKKIESKDYKSIVEDALSSEAGKLSIPSMDHWYPLLYTLGAAEENDHLKFEYEGIENSSISMRCLSLS